VGLFTSPHLVSFRERIQINRHLISESDVVRLVEELKPLLKEFPEDLHPTFFEAVTIMALRHFATKTCDVVIWETGLGGRLDATNIVTPLASLITNIGIDHAAWLGDTVEKIAAEKAGIINLACRW
jgi:dihydrofolate synthase/folylpolyglutamate synthase